MERRVHIWGTGEDEIGTATAATGARSVFSARFDGNPKIDGAIFESFTVASWEMSFIERGI